MRWMRTLKSSFWPSYNQQSLLPATFLAIVLANALETIIILS